MRISRKPQTFSWEHADFGLRGLFRKWCGKWRDVAGVRGSWVKKWVPSGIQSLNSEWLIADGVGADKSAPVWANTRNVAAALTADGFGDVRTIGHPAIYVPDWEVHRLGGSVLVLVGGAETGLMQVLGEVEVFLSAVRSALGKGGRVTVCLGEGMYTEAREWVWRRRFEGVDVICFEENPLCGESLAEAAVLFSRFEYVSGDTPGHWVPHAALRGAKVSIRQRENQEGVYFSSKVLPEWLCGEVLSAPIAEDWAKVELGWEDRLEAGAMAEAFGWPSVNPESVANRPTLGISETLELAPRQLVEEAIAEGHSDGLLEWLERNPETPLRADLSVSLALLLVRKGNAVRAVGVLEPHTKGTGVDIPSVVLLGELLCYLGRFAEAGSLLTRTLQTQKPHPAVVVSLGAFVEGKTGAVSSQEMFAMGLDLARNYGARVVWPQYSRGVGRGRVLMVSCTAKPECRESELQIVKSFRANYGSRESRVDLDLSFSNTRGLPEVYNAKLAQAAVAGYEYVVFVHDDAYLDDSRLPEKLALTHEECGFHLMGVAGAARADLKGPGLWHWMAPREEWRGTIFNVMKKYDAVMASGFGPTPAPALFVDGVFMAVHVPSVMAVGWGFNESFRFHHYDLAACLDAKSKGLSVGVAPIHVIHDSIGLSSVKDPIWKESDEIFARLYGKTDA
ncbi:MAG: glycosyltransferase [Verrucomicrobiota bacterium]